MSYIPDNNDYARMEDERIARLEEKLPKCDDCGEPITDDYLYEIDGEILCEECFNDRYRNATEDFMK